MKQLYVSLLLFLFAVTMCYAQIGIGTISPDKSSELDIVASNKGILIPRISLTSSTDATTISTGNVISLLVYNTATVADIIPGYYYWNGTKWMRLALASETYSLTASAPTGSSVNGFSLSAATGAVTMNLTPADATNPGIITTGTQTIAGAKTFNNKVIVTTAPVDPNDVARKQELDLKESLSNKSTSATLGTSNVLYPTQNAVKTYVDSKIPTIYGTSYTKEWNGALTPAAGASTVTFDFAAAGFTTISNVMVSTELPGGGVNNAPFGVITARNLTNITVSLFDSNNSTVVLASTINGLEPHFAAGTVVYLTVKGN